MEYIVTITSQGQITIPAKVHRQLHLDQTRTARLKVTDQEIILTPPVNAHSLIGMLPSKKQISMNAIHEEFEKTGMKF